MLGLRKHLSWASQSTHQSVGFVACLICTCKIPVARSASWEKAALVTSTCLVPSAHPAHESMTRTKTHLEGPLHTITTELAKSVVHTANKVSLPTFKKLEALGFRYPPIQGEGACKRIILSSQSCIKSHHSCCHFVSPLGPTPSLSSSLG